MIETLIHIYINDQLTDTFELFEEDYASFLICIDEREESRLFWFVPDPFGNKSRYVKSNQMEGYGSSVIWYSPHHFFGVPPDWELQVNGHHCETGLYRDLHVKWHKIELKHKSYRFEFIFPAFENTNEHEFPSPVLKMSAAEWEEWDKRDELNRRK